VTAVISRRRFASACRHAEPSSANDADPFSSNPAGKHHFHFTPTSSSWMNLVERWFAELTNKWLRRGTHRSVKELAASITHWVGTWNDDPRPYVWHKTADEIFDSLAAYCERISESGD
jgi:transposase